jgi:hypothetical protein
VADVSQIYPIISFAQKALGICRADEALGRVLLVVEIENTSFVHNYLPVHTGRGGHHGIVEECLDITAAS